MFHRMWRLPAALLALLAAPTLAQDSRLTIETKVTPAQAKPGDEVTVEVYCEIEIGYHIYGGQNEVEPTRLVVTSAPGLETVGAPEIPLGAPHTAGGITSFWVEPDATLRQKFRVTDQASNGPLVIKGTVDYMACTPEFCDPPGSDDWQVTLQVVGGKERAEQPAEQPAGQPAGQPVEQPVEQPAAQQPQQQPQQQPAAQQPGGEVPLLPAFDDPDDPHKATLRAFFEPARARPGEQVQLVVEATVEPGWYLYGAAEPGGIPTKLRELRSATLYPSGDAVVPPGEVKSTPIGDQWILRGTFRATQQVVVPPAAAPGSHRVAGELAYMACDESHCLEATSSAFEAELQVEAGAPRPARAATAEQLASASAFLASGGSGNRDPGGSDNTGGGNTGGGNAGDGPVAPAAGGVGELPLFTVPAGVDPETVPVERAAPKFSLEEGSALTGSLWSLILLCIGGGLIALVMPCTYPMIPITFSFFTKQADARGGKVLPLALAYGAGIVIIFMVIGAVVGEVIITFAAHWATNLVIGGAFVFFAFALFGWVNLQPPAFLLRAAGKASATGGLLGVFLMGATLVVTSFTCTAPIVGSLLAGVAEAGLGRIVFGMGVFGLTMAAPFVLLALLPGRVKALPRSGDWMHTLKVALGFVELAAAFKFLSNVDVALNLEMMPREVFLILWAFVFTLLALFLFGLFGHRGAPLQGVTVKRNAFGIASLGFAFYCLFGTMGFQLDFVMTAFEPPYRLRAIEEHPIVVDDYPAAVAKARQEDRYLLVNFTGFT